jgi:2-furoyl-CoA dehydrogenase large subunit
MSNSGARQTLDNTAVAAESAAHERTFRYVGHHRRTKEDRRFVAGHGKFVADIELPGMLHVALLMSPHAHATINSLDPSAALALAGVVRIVTGEDIAALLAPMPHGLHLPEIRGFPLALERVLYAGEWVAAVVATSRAIAEDALELIEVDYTELEPIVDPERALKGGPLVHPQHGTNVLFQRTFTWREVDADFAAAEHQLSHRVRWGRNATVPIETFGVIAKHDPGTDILDVWASIQMPKFSENIASCLRIAHTSVRAHYDVDVGGSYGVKRGLKHAVLVGWLARELARPVRLIEDRLENMAGGDAHGPDRNFDVDAAFDADGTVRSLKIRALDDCGAWPGRAPLQLGKPVGAIVGPYRINSVRYEAISVATNKTGQVAVRGFGQAPTNVAIEATMDLIAEFLGRDREDLRRQNYIRAHEFPYRIPSGSEYDSGDYHAVHQKLTEAATAANIWQWKAELRERGLLAGVGIASVLEPGGGNAAFEPLMNPRNDTTTWMESCLLRVDRDGGISVAIATSTSGQGHETLMATALGEELGIDPDLIRVIHSDTLIGLPSNTPVASRMAIMMGGAAAGAAGVLINKLKQIAAYNLSLDAEELSYDRGVVFVTSDPSQRLGWPELVGIAHRQYHRMPPGMEPGLQAQYVYQVPKGRDLPAADGTVQMYPCYAFEAHMPLISIDPLTGEVQIHAYLIAHDCGTLINPDIVKGMCCGGIAHGIGAALYEEFSYDAHGQLLTGTLMDYPMPSTREVPAITLLEHCTPSPLTSFGQKGAGEAGYLGAPAAIVSAVNDALAPFNQNISNLPMRAADIAKLIPAHAITASANRL